MKSQYKPYRWPHESDLSEEEVRRRREEDDRLLMRDADLRAAQRAADSRAQKAARLDQSLDQYWKKA